MKKFITDMFSSSEGTSHKRILGAIGFISLVVYMFTCQSVENTNTIIEAVEYTTIAYGLGTVAEKFIKKPVATPKQEDDI